MGCGPVEMVRVKPMIVGRGWGPALAMVIAVVCGARARAAEGDRIVEVLAARVDMQRQLGEWLTKSLSGPAEPYRIEAVVRLEVRAAVRETRAKQANVTPSVKVGGKNRVKLPGLGMVEGGGGQANILPEITIEGETRVTESVSRQIETEVVRMTVLLFVDPTMPAERREMLARLASQLAGVDAARGDQVVVEERPQPPPGANPTLVAATLAAPKRLAEVIAFCLTALVAAAILAVGLSRRSGAERALAAGGRAGGPDAPAEAAREEAPRIAAAEEIRKRREELRAFKVLVDTTPRELVQVVAEADPATAATIVELVGLDEEAAKLAETMLPQARRLEIGIGLATSRVITREQLTQMEAISAQVLARVRNRVALGGPTRLAEFLASAPSQLRNEVLEGVASRDRGLAQAARGAMLLFEDLPRLADATVRQVVTAVDPGTVALALVGAPDVREVVHAAVSKRLRGILEVEEEALRERPAPEIESARRAIEDAMRRLRERGEIRARAA